MTPQLVSSRAFNGAIIQGMDRMVLKPPRSRAHGKSLHWGICVRSIIPSRKIYRMSKLGPLIGTRQVSLWGHVIGMCDLSQYFRYSKELPKDTFSSS